LRRKVKIGKGSLPSGEMTGPWPVARIVSGRRRHRTGKHDHLGASGPLYNTSRIRDTPKTKTKLRGLRRGSRGNQKPTEGIITRSIRNPEPREEKLGRGGRCVTGKKNGGKRNLVPRKGGSRGTSASSRFINPNKQEKTFCSHRKGAYCPYRDPPSSKHQLQTRLIAEVSYNLVYSDRDRMWLGWGEGKSKKTGVNKGSKRKRDAFLLGEEWGE